MTDRVDLEASFASNQRLWDAWTKVHAEGEFYDVAGFREGGLRLRPYEVAALGDVTGKTLLHLQCHFGLDTLSWARLGAKVTGVDFSHASIVLARELAADIGIPDARFVESNVYQLPVRLGDEFDIVYTSRGVLGWLPDIRGWARVVARFVKPGGRFYISEVHPVLQVFENEGVSPRELRLQYPYWEHGNPLIFDVHGSYADPDADLGTEHKEHGWDHGLGESRHGADRRGTSHRAAGGAAIPRMGGRLPRRERAGERAVRAAGGPWRATADVLAARLETGLAPDPASAKL